MRTSGVCLVSIVALLSACSRPHAPAQPAPSAGAASVTTRGPGGFVRPQRKAGLWLMSISTNSGPGISLNGEMCLDAQTEKTAGFDAGSGSRDCGKPVFHAAPGGMSFDTVCKFGKRTMTTHGVATGDFSNNYQMTLKTRTDPPLPVGQAETTTQIKAKWMGPCKPGQKPGSVSMKLGSIGPG